jgi:type III pantothenate kinase
MISAPALLLIDVGNTTIAMAVCRGAHFKEYPALETNLPAAKQAVELNKAFCRIVREFPRLESALVCCVVPRVLKPLSAQLRAVLKIPVSVIGKDIVVPLTNCYTHPHQVGQDRLVSAYAAMRLYGYPVIVIDLGTAITIDVVSAKKEYLGGIIVPGIRLSAESLYHKTALLPLVDIHKPSRLIGKDTQGSILSGIFYGYGELIQGLVRRIQITMRQDINVIVTGGYTQLMRIFLAEMPHVIDRRLIFKGMKGLWGIPGMSRGGSRSLSTRTE